MEREANDRIETLQQLKAQIGRGDEPGPGPFDLFLAPANALFPLKAGDELFADLPDAEPRRVPMVFQVALSEPGYLEASSLLDTLSKFTDAVEAVIQALTPHLA